ncbi:hypothetical protein B0H14DRAFT_2654170, partial [Mycena olivaceomarginata]
MDPGYWAGTHLDGDVPLDHEDKDSDDDDEQVDQLDWSEPRPPPAASTDRPHIDPLSFSTGSIAVPDASDIEREEQVGGGHKWLEATGPTTPPRTRLRAEIKPTQHASASTKASIVRRAEAAKSPPLPPPREIGPPPPPNTMAPPPLPPDLQPPAPVQGSSTLPRRQSRPSMLLPPASILSAAALPLVPGSSAPAASPSVRGLSLLPPRSLWNLLPPPRSHGNAPPPSAQVLAQVHAPVPLPAAQVPGAPVVQVLSVPAPPVQAHPAPKALYPRPHFLPGTSASARAPPPPSTENPPPPIKTSTRSGSPPLSFPPIAAFSATPPRQPLSLPPPNARQFPPPPPAPMHPPGTINIGDYRGDLSTFLDMGGFSPIRLPPPPDALDLLPQNIQEVNVGGVGGAGGNDFEGDNLGGNNIQDYDLEGDNFGGASSDDFEGDSFGGAGSDFDRSFQDIDRDIDSGS